MRRGGTCLPTDVSNLWDYLDDSFYLCTKDAADFLRQGRPLGMDACALGLEVLS